MSGTYTFTVTVHVDTDEDEAVEFPAYLRGEVLYRVDNETPDDVTVVVTPITTDWSPV